MREPAATVAAIAARQHGRVSRGQLVAAGIDAGRIDRWLADGRLHRVHTGVHAVGHLAPSVAADYIAAVLAAGSGAVLSHRAAAYRLGMRRGAAPAPEVTIPTTDNRRRPRIVIHRVRALHGADISILDGIPITTIARTLLDLAPTTRATERTRMAHEAWVRHGTTPTHVEACIARNPFKPGARNLLRALGAGVTLSGPEDGFVALMAAHGLPRPRTNEDLAGDKVDFHWPGPGLTVELHSHRFHATRRAFEDDLARRRRSRHVAYSWGDVFERGPATAADVRRRLDAAAAQRAPRGQTAGIQP